MVPTPYRLETVAGSLVERLDAVRRSVGPGEALARFRRLAEAHVRAAVAEWEELDWGDGGAQARLLREEILETAVPRITRLMEAQSLREAEGFGFGSLYDPARRVGLGLVGLAVVGLVVLRLGLAAMLGWLALPALLLLLAPDAAALAAQRRYAADLAEVLVDLGRIQAQAGDYAEAAPEAVTGERAAGPGERAGAQRGARQAAEQEGSWPRS